MEHSKRVFKEIAGRVWLATFVLHSIGILGLIWAASEYALSITWLIPLAIGVEVMVSLLISFMAARWAMMPLVSLGQAVLHLSPSSTAEKSPALEQLRVGRQFVTSVAYQLYQIASLQDNKDMAEHRREATQSSNILAHFPLPVFVFNKEQIVTFATDTAFSYTGKDSANLFGKPIYEVIDLEFPSDFTLEKWIADCQTNKATDTAHWRHVRLRLNDEQNTLKQCDMAGYYNRDNPSGIEFIITMFDRTDEYANEDKSINSVALAVHELRTPLTILRGYIELFQEELEGKLDTNMSVSMDRLQASARQVTAFVNNILNMSRIEGDQLSVKLAEENWPEIIKHAVSDMSIRARAADKTIIINVAPDLPTVAADRFTIYEVLCNLLDNSIKYGGKSKEIKLTASLTKDNLVETLVEDKGVGIPTSVMPTLFERFKRNFRNKNSVSGTGLGLYISKAIVNAHEGDIWVKSKEGQGTTVGFTIKPYAQIAEELKQGKDANSMVRTAHGWIKNHSLYRR